jgi:hypothetical protein
MEATMSVSQAHVLTTGAGLAIVLSTIVVAQTQAPPTDKKSHEIGTFLEGDAYMIGKDMRLHGSNVRVTAA